MSIKEFREGVAILSKYEDENDFVIAAEDGQIWLGPKNADTVSFEDATLLRELDWFIDERQGSWSFFCEGE
jgi:hypothetical protein